MKQVTMIQDEISGHVFPDMAHYAAYHDSENGKQPSLFRQVSVEVADDSDLLKSYFCEFSKRFAALQKTADWKKLDDCTLENVILHDLEYIYMGFKSGEAGFTENAFYRFMAHYLIYMNRGKNGTDKQ